MRRRLRRHQIFNQLQTYDRGCRWQSRLAGQGPSKDNCFNLVSVSCCVLSYSDNYNCVHTFLAVSGQALIHRSTLYCLYNPFIGFASNLLPHSWHGVSAEIRPKAFPHTHRDRHTQSTSDPSSDDLEHSFSAKCFRRTKRQRRGGTIKRRTKER